MADGADRTMPTPAFDAHAYVNAVAPAVGFALKPEDIATVATQVERAAYFAATVSAALDNPRTAPAPVFTPVETVPSEEQSP